MNDATRSLLARLETLEGEVTRLRQQLIGELSLRDVPGGVSPLLVCAVRELRFGLLLSGVEEVVPVARVVPLPEAAPWVLGTLNLRGESLAVVDAGCRLTGETRRIGASERIVVCATERVRAGLLVEEVRELLTAPAGAITHPAPGASFAAYLVGIFHHQKESLPVVDVSKLLLHSSLPLGRAEEARS